MGPLPCESSSVWRMGSPQAWYPSLPVLVILAVTNAASDFHGLSFLRWRLEPTLDTPPFENNSLPPLGLGETTPTLGHSLNCFGDKIGCQHGIPQSSDHWQVALISEPTSTPAQGLSQSQYDLTQKGTCRCVLYGMAGFSQPSVPGARMHWGFSASSEEVLRLEEVDSNPLSQCCLSQEVDMKIPGCCV